MKVTKKTNMNTIDLIRKITCMIGTILFVFLPYNAFACSVCFSGKEETLFAYYLTTAILTFLPLALLSSIGYWLYRKQKQVA